jgi:FAD-dependent urate hydroxylase
MAKHALIIGGGIAGPTAAMALQRAGISATVYEAYPEDARAAGVFLTVAVNGIAALRTLGLDRRVMAAGFPSASIEFASGTGKSLGTVPIGGTLTDGTVAHTIRRPDLYGVLYQEAYRRGIRVEHGKRLIAAEPTAGGVVARFEDGTSAAGDVLIGADGIHSPTRRIIDTSAPAPRYTGLGNVGGYTRGSGLGFRDSGTYTMIFGKRAFFGYVVSPAGEVWWFTNPPWHTELSPAELQATPEQWKERLGDLFDGDSGPAVDIIRNASVLAVTNQHDLPRVPRWSRGPMIVIGDAAHAASPTSGQGASLAIEDAIVLARCLGDLPTTAAAFASYRGRAR